MERQEFYDMTSIMPTTINKMSDAHAASEKRKILSPVKMVWLLCFLTKCSFYPGVSYLAAAAGVEPPETNAIFADARLTIPSGSGE